MKLVKKVNHRIMALLCLVVILQTLLWIGAIITGALTINGGILLITLIFSFICTVGVLVLRLTNFFTKDFIAFYNSLDSYEKAALAQTKEIPAVFMLAELQRKNPGIIVR